MHENFTCLIGDVVSILAVPRERLKDWILRGYISASIQEQQGKRTLNRFTYFDLVMIDTFRFLLSASFSRKQAKFCVDLLRMDINGLLDPTTRFVAFFKWPIGPRHFPNWPNKKSQNGQITPQAQYRIIADQDVKKTFETLFINFTDVTPPFGRVVRLIPFEFLHIINFRELREILEAKILIYLKE